MVVDEYDLPPYLPYYYDKDGYLLGNSFLPKLRCTLKELNQFLAMDLDLEIRSRAWGDFRCAPYERTQPEIDDESCSKDAVKMLKAAEALISHLSVGGTDLPQTRAHLSELGGIHRQWGHWYRPLLSEPIDLDGSGLFVLICCGFHSYRINIKFNSTKKWEMVLNQNITEALRQHEVHEQSLQVAS